MSCLRDSLRIMENDARRVTVPGPQSADTMPQIDAISSPRTLHRPVVHREHCRVPAPKRHDFDPRLHAGPLFGQHELAAGEVVSWLRQQDHHLERKNVFAVEVLMQAIVITLSVSKGGAGSGGSGRLCDSA